MRADPRSALARRTNSSALGVPAGDTRPSRRSRYSPASMPKNSAIPIWAIPTPHPCPLSLGERGSVTRLPALTTKLHATRWIGTRSTPSRTVDQRAHFTNRGTDGGENAAADDAVADVELLDLRDRGDRLHVEIGEPVTRVDGEAGLPADRGGALEPREGPGAGLCGGGGA